MSGAVACSWFSQWQQATSAGDNAGAREAIDAMSTARRWPVLLDMNAEGDYPEVVWELADKMAAGTVESGEFESGLGCGYPPLSDYAR